MWRDRVGYRSSAMIVGLLLLAASAGDAAQHYRPRQGSSTPIVTLTNSAGTARTVEARLARFILLLQAQDRAAASRLLSRRVSATHRRRFRAGTWLARESTQDFALIYYLPAIRVRSLGISRTRAVVRVEPLTPYAPREMPIGFIDVPMYYESGRWQVQPAPVALKRTKKK